MPSKKVTVTLTDVLFERVEKLKFCKGLTRSQIVAIAVEEYTRKELPNYTQDK